MGIFLFTILCFKSAGRSARVAAEGLQFLRISSIRVAERKEGGSKTSPGRGSRRPCPKWNSPRLLHVLHFFHTMLCSVLHLFQPLTFCINLSPSVLNCVQYIYQYAMTVGRPPGCNLASLNVFKNDIPKVPPRLIYLIHHFTTFAISAIWVDDVDDDHMMLMVSSQLFSFIQHDEQ